MRVMISVLVLIFSFSAYANCEKSKDSANSTMNVISVNNYGINSAEFPRPTFDGNKVIAPTGYYFEIGSTGQTIQMKKNGGGSTGVVVICDTCPSCHWKQTGFENMMYCQGFCEPSGCHPYVW